MKERRWFVATVFLFGFIVGCATYQARDIVIDPAVAETGAKYHNVCESFGHVNFERGLQGWIKAMGKKGYKVAAITTTTLDVIVCLTGKKS